MKTQGKFTKKMMLLATIIITFVACNTKKSDSVSELKTDEVKRDTLIQERVVQTPYYVQQSSVQREGEEESNSGMEQNSTTVSQTGNTSTTAPVKEKKRLSNKAKGAMIGAGVGAVTGAVVNKKSRVKGAVIGGVAGAAVGFGVGAILDKKKKDAAAE